MMLHYITGRLLAGSGKDFISDQNTMARFMEKISVIEGGCWNWTGATVRGYGHFRVQSSDGWKMLRSHIYIARVVNQVADEVIRHTCDNRLCCNPDHLIGGSHQDNADDCTSRDRQAKGSAKIPHSLKDSPGVLTEDKVRAIREMKAQGMKQVAIARQIGTSVSQVSRVILGQTWSHVK